MRMSRKFFTFLYPQTFAYLKRWKGVTSFSISSGNIQSIVCEVVSPRA